MKSDYDKAAGVDNHETKRNIQPLPASPLLPILGGIGAGILFLIVVGIIMFAAGRL